MATRLAPSASLDTGFFWEGVQQHRLLIQRCAGCGELRHPPRPMCPRCHSLDWDTLEASGRGTLYSCCTPRHPMLPWHEEDYIVALVELEEGTRLVTNLVGVAPDDARIGMSVRVVFEEFDGGLVLPMFTPAVVTPAVVTPAVAAPAVVTPAVAAPAVVTPAVVTPDMGVER